MCCLLSLFLIVHRYLRTILLFLHIIETDFSIMMQPSKFFELPSLAVKQNLSPTCFPRSLSRWKINSPVAVFSTEETYLAFILLKSKKSVWPPINLPMVLSECISPMRYKPTYFFFFCWGHYLSVPSFPRLNVTSSRMAAPVSRTGLGISVKYSHCVICCPHGPYNSRN